MVKKNKSIEVRESKLVEDLQATIPSDLHRTLVNINEERRKTENNQWKSSMKTRKALTCH